MPVKGKPTFYIKQELEISFCFLHGVERWKTLSACIYFTLLTGIPGGIVATRLLLSSLQHNKKHFFPWCDSKRHETLMGSFVQFWPIEVWMTLRHTECRGGTRQEEALKSVKQCIKMDRRCLILLLSRVQFWLLLNEPKLSNCKADLK